MADPQHIEWLEEGVEAWNERRRLNPFYARELFQPDLRGVNLAGAILHKAYLVNADLEGTILRRSGMISAHLAKANLAGADLDHANLSRSNLRGACLTGASLIGTYLPSSTLIEDLDVRGVDLSQTKGLNRRYIHLMRGDHNTKLPARLEMPEAWKERDQSTAPEPIVPAAPVGHAVESSGNSLSLGTPSNDLDETALGGLFEDLRDAVDDLHEFGNLDNQCPMLSKGVERFLKRLPETIEQLDQVRFGTSVQALSLQFKHERPVLEEVAPEKLGHLEATLMRANLIAANLPLWLAFKKQEEETEPVFAARQDDIEAIFEHAAEALESDPEHFDPSLFERIREYLDDATMVSYLASKDLLVGIAHKTFVLARDLAKDTVSEARKMTIKGIAGALLAHLAGPLLKLAGILPNELAWLAQWIEYLPKIL